MKNITTSISNLLSSFKTEVRREALPKRVRETIERSDDMSEALVKLIQLIIFSIWGVLYFSAPKPQSGHRILGTNHCRNLFGYHLYRVCMGLFQTHSSAGGIYLDFYRYRLDDFFDRQLSCSIWAGCIIFA